MGIDIHAFVEQRNKETGEWEELTMYIKDGDGNYMPIRFFDGLRDSTLFCLLGGVRGSFFYLFNGCLVPNRGLPDDLSEEVKKEYGSLDCYYCETWYDYCELYAYSYTLKQCKEMIVSYHKQNNDDDFFTDDSVSFIDSLEDFINRINWVLESYNVWYTKPGEIRIVMWFNS